VKSEHSSLQQQKLTLIVDHAEYFYTAAYKPSESEAVLYSSLSSESLVTVANLNSVESQVTTICRPMAMLQHLVITCQLWAPRHNLQSRIQNQFDHK